jgi:N-acetylmuramoyl-L-alanine amidase
MRGAGFGPSLYHAEPIPGESKPFADRANGVHYYDNLVVLHTATQPAVLFEAGVIVNRAEELALREPATRGRIAEAVADGVRSCLVSRRRL